MNTHYEPTRYYVYAASSDPSDELTFIFLICLHASHPCRDCRGRYMLLHQSRVDYASRDRAPRVSVHARASEPGIPYFSTGADLLVKHCKTKERHFIRQFISIVTKWKSDHIQWKSIVELVFIFLFRNTAFWKTVYSIGLVLPLASACFSFLVALCAIK